MAPEDSDAEERSALVEGTQERFNSLARVVMDGASKNYQLAVLAVAGALFLVLVYLAFAAASGDQRGSFVSVILLIGLFIGLAIFVLRLPVAESPGLEERWTRSVPALDLEPAAAAALGDKLEAIRATARDFLAARAAKPEAIEDADVRANVFLADYRSPKPHRVFELFMPPLLRRKMDRSEEWKVVFGPGEGATGVVFMEGGTRVKSGRSFVVPQQFKDDFHPDLKFVTSIPVKDAKSKTTLAVLNIDGLRVDFPEATLKSMAAHVAPGVDDFAELLSLQPRVRMVVGSEPI